jgi:hypothetical protein
MLGMDALTTFVGLLLLGAMVGYVRRGRRAPARTYPATLA